MSKIKFNQFRQSGQNLMEMSIVMSLLACACIGALLMVGGQAKKGILDVIFGNVQESVRVSKAQSMLAPVYVVDESRYKQNKLLTESVCVNEKVCIDVPILSSQTITETSGGQGGQLTYELSMSLRQIAEQLANDPNVDPSFIAQISELANLGHMLSEGQMDAINLCKPGQSCSERVYTQLLSKLGNVQETLSSFQGKAAILHSGMQTSTISPAIQTLIQKEVTNIAAIAKAYDPNAVSKDTSTESRLVQSSTPSSTGTVSSSSTPNSTMVGDTLVINKLESFTGSSSSSSIPTTTTVTTQVTEVSWGFTENPTLTAISANSICSQGGDSSCQKQVQNPDPPSNGQSATASDAATVSQQ